MKDYEPPKQKYERLARKYDLTSEVVEYMINCVSQYLKPDSDMGYQKILSYDYNREYNEDYKNWKESNRKSRQFLEARNLLPSNLPVGLESYYLVRLYRAFKFSDYMKKMRNTNDYEYENETEGQEKKEPFDYFTLENVKNANLDFVVDYRLGTTVNKEHGDLISRTDLRGYDLDDIRIAIMTEKGSKMILYSNVPDQNGGKAVLASMMIESYDELSESVLSHVSIVKPYVSENDGEFEEKFNDSITETQMIESDHYGVHELLRMSKLGNGRYVGDRESFFNRIMTCMYPSFENYLFGLMLLNDKVPGAYRITFDSFEDSVIRSCKEYVTGRLKKCISGLKEEGAFEKESILAKIRIRKHLNKINIRKKSNSYKFQDTK